MEQERVRDHRFDNMKALLIFLVVLGHVLSNYGVTAGSDFLYKVIFSFHMPAFIFVSGYFAKQDPKRVLAKLVPLYVVFQCARFLLDAVLAVITGGDGLAALREFQLFTPCWTLWYLLALIIYQLLLPVFTTDNRKHRLYFMILAAALGLLVGLNHDMGKFLSISRVLVFLPFFLLGYYERDSHILTEFGKNRHPRASRVITGCLAAALLTVFALLHRGMRAVWFYGSDPYEPGIFAWPHRVMAWGIALLWIWILLVWTPERELPLVGTVGAHTLSVYLLHSLSIRILLVTPLGTLMNGNLAALILLAAALTIILSWKGFDRVLKKIALPVRREPRSAQGGSHQMG